MKTSVAVLSFLIAINAFGFTLLRDNVHVFSGRTISIHVTTDDCSELPISKEELLELAMKATNKYWSAGPLTFKRGKINHNKSENSIIISCQKPENDAFIEGNVLGSIHYVLINDTKEIWGTITEQFLVQYFAHEIGHALGLGHSQQQDALMNPLATTSLSVERASVDDLGGLSFLYR